MAREWLRIRYRNASNRDIASAAATYGVPLPEGAMKRADGLAIRRPDGALAPVQVKPLERWPDGSIRWLLLDFELPLKANEEGEAALVSGSRARSGSAGLAVRSAAGALTVTTRRLTVALSRRRFSLFDAYEADGRNRVLPGSDIVVEDLNGKRYYASLARSLDVRVIEQGPQRAVVQVSGRHTAEDDSEFLDFRVRYTFRPNEPGVALSYRFSNREPPETGVKLASIQLVIPTALGDRTTKLVRQSNHGVEWFSRRVEVRENVELIAGKAVNEAARTRYGAASEGKILIRNLGSLKENPAEYPYYLRPGNARADMTGGIRQMYPYLGLAGDGGSAVAWFFDMENNFPKGLRAERHVLAFDVWPSCSGDLHVRRGQSKEHDLYVALAGPRSHEELEAIYFDHEIVGVGVLGASSRPLELTLDPAYARACRALDVHRWLPYDERRYSAIETKLGSAGAKASYSCKGMWDLGDHISGDRSWAHNNENDAILNMLREHFRRAEPTERACALEKARHNAHVDFIAFDPDPLRQGTMPAHCPEHTDGATYPSHMWVDGLMAAYCVSGEPDFLEAALAVGENMLRWQKRRPSIFYADSRECGWPFLAFLRLHEHTGERRWLDACEAIFRFYRRHVADDGRFYYELPHGVGTVRTGYGEFITWRSLFFYWERTGKPEVKRFLVTCLEKVYRLRPGVMVGGWACNDLFPAWAAFVLTGDDKYIEDNYPFLQFLMERQGGFPWGGVDMHYYLAELDRRGTLARFAGGTAAE